MYSSGMYSRLAFAVNIHVSAEILIVDEILSVGDHFFQAKCMSAISKMMLNGVTILLVSHSQAQILSLCERALLLNKGELIACGKSDMVVDKYMALCLSEERETQYKNAERNTDNDLNKINVNSKYTSKLLPSFNKRITERLGDGRANYIECILSYKNSECYTVPTGDDCEIIAMIKINKDIETDSEIGLTVRTMEGIDLFALNSFFMNKKVPPLKSGQLLKCVFNFTNKLGPGKYSISLGMRSPVQGEYVEKVYNCCIFDVVNSSSRVVPLLFDVQGEMKLELCN